MNTTTQFNLKQRTAFKVMQGETYTVGDSVTSSSPTSQYLASPAGNFDAVRTSVGGEIYAAFSDVAGPASLDFQCHINPGDVIAVAAIGGGKALVTINGVLALTITATSVCGLLGFWG